MNKHVVFVCQTQTKITRRQIHRVYLIDTHDEASKATSDTVKQPAVVCPLSRTRQRAVCRRNKTNGW
jgi:hypothetical protein